MSEELKLVITLKEGKGAIGIQAPDCDPVFSAFEGEMAVALKQVPKILKEAQAKWAENPQNPKGEVPPKPEVAKPVQRTTPPARSSGRRQTTTRPQQDRLF